MNANFDFWRMLAGIGLFLFAMAQLEIVLNELGGRRLTRFLREHTERRLSAVYGGIVATALLQSSSVVGLMVLAFVGAGFLALPNALGIVFGSNLGTTLTGWIVATLGFKVDIDALVLPLLGGGGLLFVAGRERKAQIGRLAVCLGLLLLGLQFMKDSVAALQASVDIAALSVYAPWQYLLFGCVLAAVIQSSSATMMVALAALNAEIITLPSAAALAIGANLGTTTTVVLGAINGSASKRRVAMAHVIFNAVAAAIAFVLRVPLLAVVAALGISDPLYSLVAFHSLFNLLGLIIFVPFVTPFARYLERFFQTEVAARTRFVGEVDPVVSEAALQALDRETAHLIGRVIDQNRLAIMPPVPVPPGRPPVDDGVADAPDSRQFDAMYHTTKELEGEILAFAIRLQGQPLDEAESARLNQLLAAVRQAVHSSKMLKDIRHDLAEFRDSPNERVNAYLDHFRGLMIRYFGEIYSLRRSGESRIAFEEFVDLMQDVHEWHDRMHEEIYTDVSANAVRQAAVSSLLNVNREILNSNIALLMALKDYHLDVEQAQVIARLPGAG